MSDVFKLLVIKTKRFLSMLPLIIAIILFVIGVILGYMKYWPYPDPYIIVNPERHTARMVDEHTIAIRREFIINETKTYSVFRELCMPAPECGENERPNNIVTVRIELPSTSVTFRPGQYAPETRFWVPKLNPGIYVLRSWACWPVNVIRDKCKDVPSLLIEVPERFN